VRSLGPARDRAEVRVQRFLDAARELLIESDPKALTVQQVAEHSGQSLRSFYQYFSGRHQLLLALFEEDIIWTAEHIGRIVAQVADPLERIRVFVLECRRLSLPVPPDWEPTGHQPHPTALAEFAQELLTQHSREAARAFGPLVDLLEEILVEAGAAGALQSNLDPRRVAGILLQVVMFDAFAATISGSSLRADGHEDLWQLVLHGIAVK
jgi:AcrR family transcriptional regulator